VTASLLRSLGVEDADGGKALRRQIVLAMFVAVASVVLLGLSGWFLAGAALAGAAGPVVARGFNYLLPAAAIRLMAILRTGARYGERLTGHQAAFAAMTRVRARLYRSIAAMPPARALDVGRGEAVARLVQDAGAIEAALVRRSAPWSAGAAIVAAIASVAWIGWVGAALFALVAGAAIVIGERLSRTVLRPARSVQHSAGALKQRLLDYADAAAELRCFDLADRAAAEIDGLAADLDLAAAEQLRRTAWIEAVLPLAATFAAVGLLLSGAFADAPAAALGALAGLAAIGELGGMSRIFAERGAVDDARTRLGEYLSAPARGSVTAILPERPTIALRGGLAAACGAVVAIEGPSGSGKTTLVETLLGLRDASAGMAEIGGVDIALIPPEELRRVFAWLPQDAQLLTGTVRDNLSLARPDAGEAVFRDALEDAMIADRIRAMPRGLDTWIGENGEQLSGGERRRLALARAYCSDAPWLLLDEPLAAIDRATADEMMRRLSARIDRTGQGAILVTHASMELPVAVQMAVSG